MSNFEEGDAVVIDAEGNEYDGHWGTVEHVYPGGRMYEVYVQGTRLRDPTFQFYADELSDPYES